MSRILHVCVLLASSWLLASCGADATTGTSEVSFVLTDAATDELAQFEVDVANIVMTKLDGSTVSVMPRATRVDFVELTSVGELVTALQIPAGSYTALAMDLDFTNAAIVILGQTGAASVVDASGAPITGTVTVNVDFAPQARPVVRRGRHHLFQLDLDLDQAVTVDVGANEVRFSPVLTATVDPSNPRPVATTGLLGAINTTDGLFTVERRALDGNTIATFTVQTFNITMFQVDGTVLQGAAGLAAMAPFAGQRVFLQGTLDPAVRVFEALAVEIGAGVPGNGQDWVFGHVTGRDNGAGSDAALTVVGRSFDVGTSTRRYNAAHTVNVAYANTKVLRRAAGNSLDTDAINVGQLVFAFGNLAGTVLDATATTGVVRLFKTRVFGIAAGAASGGVLTLDVARFDLRNDSAFNFTVGGTSQADPNAFTIDAGLLSTTGIVAGSKLEVAAWINPVGISGDTAADAVAITDRTNGARVLLLQWGTPSSIAIAGTTAASVTLDITGAVVATVGDGFAPVTVTSAPAPSLRPLFSLGAYRILDGASVSVYFTFDTFRTALATAVASHNVARIAALGTYDQATQAFSALTATVVLD